MVFHNSALIQDEVLLNLALVIDHGHPAGPSFLHSLGTLVEAVVLHEQVYFDAAQSNGGDRHEITLASIIAESTIVQQLVKDGVLTQLPNDDEIDAHLGSIGSDYDSGKFTIDMWWHPVSFTTVKPEAEKDEYELRSKLMEQFPAIFLAKRLVEPGSGEALLTTDLSAYRLAQQGMPADDLIELEGLNRRVHAYVDMARNLGLNLYLHDRALPHQVGGIRLGNRKAWNNRKAKKIYETMEARLYSKSEDITEDSEVVGDAAFHRLQMPPSCQIVLRNCKDSKNALAEEMSNLRDSHRKFRQYLTAYDKVWYTATERDERIDLNNEFENAWKALMTLEDRPATRLMYVIWDVFKNPTKILQSIGDKAADQGRELSIIGRARGLHDFWNELKRSPTADRNHELMTKLFPYQAEPEVWEAANRFGQSASGFLKVE